MKRIAALCSLIVIFLVTYAVLPTFAVAYQKDVLGVEAIELPQIPPTAAGPGLLLPDSPLYALDNMKQQIRLFFAFSPRQKALVYNSIAGERLAELRFMLARNNKAGVETDLFGLAYNTQMATKMLSDEQLSGRTVTILAKQIDQSIKDKQGVLAQLDSQTTGEMKAQVRAAQEGLQAARDVASAALPKLDLANAERDDAVKQANEQVTDIAANVAALEQTLASLRQQASQSASAAIATKEQDLAKASKLGQTAVHDAQIALIAEKAKQEKVLADQDKAIAQAELLVKTAEATVASYKQAQLAVEHTRSQVAGAATSSAPSAK